MRFRARAILFALTLLLSVLLAACGGHHHQTVTKPPVKLRLTAPATVTPCQGANYVMQCAAGAPGQQTPQSNRSLSFHALFGFDFAWGGPPASVARAAGASFGVSYLSGTSKDWRDSQIADYLAHGLGVVFVHETSAARSTGGCKAGSADARTDEALLRGYASRLGRSSLASAPAFAASDFDTSGYSSSGSVGLYYRCYRSVLGSRAGAYGGYNTMAIARANGVTRLWQTLAWSYGRGYPGVCLYQYAINLSYRGYGVDYNHAFCSDYGQAGFRAAPPPPPPDTQHYKVLTRQELATVKMYDVARYRLGPKASEVTNLERVLAKQAHAIWVLAHARGQGGFAARNRGLRFQVVFRRSRGEEVCRAKVCS